MEPLSWCTPEAGNKSGLIVDDSRTAWAQNFLSFRETQSQTKRGEFGRVAVKLVCSKLNHGHARTPRGESSLRTSPKIWLVLNPFALQGWISQPRRAIPNLAVGSFS
jgi:hypothetical protein